METRRNEQEKLKDGATNCDFNKISLISEYEKIRLDYINTKKLE